MNALTQALSAALIHFVWQGAIIGLLLWVALISLKSRSANARYAVSCAALAVLAFTPLATLAVVLYLQAIPAGASVTVSGASQKDVIGIPQTMLPIWIEPDAPHLLWLAWAQMWVLPIWSAGVLISSGRLALGYAHAFALGRRGGPADESILTIVAAVARRMNISRPVRVLISTTSDGPSMLGWLRPIILLPPATAMGLTPPQLEAVIAHELAHIKRHDYLVNVLQAIAETLLFYHPMVWWISKQIRIERELCCDDLAVRSCGDALGYARALTTIAKMQLTAPKLAMASTGGSLVQRIQRLLGAPAQEYGPSRWSVVLALGLGLACVGLNVNWANLLAQAGADSPQFEVASVKLSKLNNRQVMINNQGGRYTATGVSLRLLIRQAYQVQENQIIGGPGWLDSDRFDVVAKAEPQTSDRAAEPNAGPSQRQLMIRALLAERFKLSVHKETRNMPVYALIMATSDGRLGPQLRKAAVDCGGPEAARGRGGNPLSPGASRGQRPGCGTTVGPGVILAGGQTLSQLATVFSTLSNTGMSLNRIVIDRTGLTGTFDVDLHFTPEQIPNFGPDSPPLGLPAIDPNGPSIFTAVQEQLGLKLDPQRGPVDVLVIDRVERPTED